MSTSTHILQRGPISVVDYRCTSGPSDRPFTEAHTKHSISYVRKGSFGYQWRGRSFELVAGAVLVGCPGDEYVCTHEHHHSGDECLSFQYSPEVIEEIAPKAQWMIGPLPPLPPLVVLGEWAQGAASSDNDADFDEVGLMLVARLAQVVGVRTKTVKPGIRHRRRAVETALWMDANAGDAIDLSAAARIAGLSRYHFLRVFSAVTGVTPHQYLVRARLRKAARLLVASEQPITDVALEVGFSDISNFVRTFSRAAGMSPGVFRRAARSDSNFFQDAALARS